MANDVRNVDLRLASPAHMPAEAEWAALELERRNALAHAIVATVREPLIVLDWQLRVVAASRSFLKLFQLGTPDVLGHSFFTLGAGQWNVPTLRGLLDDVVSRDRAIDGFKIELDIPSAGRRHLILNARQMLDNSGPHRAVLVGLEDATARDEAENLKDLLLRKQETLLAEIQHRVANSLQVIASILLLKARTVASEDARAELRDVHKRVVLFAAVQRQLTASALTDDIALGPYLSLLCKGLSSAMISDNKPVSVTTACTDSCVKRDDAVSLGLIVTELVINALKHGFPDGRTGRITVDFAGDVLGWRLAVSDDGVGRQHDCAEPDHVGLGTTIVGALARQLKASVETNSSDPGAMTTVTHKKNGELVA